MGERQKLSSSESRRREKRRKRILENGESRMDRLRNAQRSTSPETHSETDSNQLSRTLRTLEKEGLCMSEQSTSSLPGFPPEPENVAVSAAEPSNQLKPLLSPVQENKLVEDATEMISMSSFPTTKLQEEVRDTQDSVPEAKWESLLAKTPTLFGGMWPWRIRTGLAIVCGIICFILDNLTEWRHSCVVLMVALDFGWLFFLLTFQPSYNVSRTAANPLAWLSLIKVPFLFLPAIFLKLFDNLVSFVWLLTQFLRDMFVMLFITVLLRSLSVYIHHDF